MCDPSPSMARWLMFPNILEGESIAKSKTISFFFSFFSLHIYPLFCPVLFWSFCTILPPLMGDPLTPLSPSKLDWCFQIFLKVDRSWIQNHLVSAQNQTSVWEKITILLILVHFATLHARPLNPSCLQMVHSSRLHKYTCTFDILVIICSIC